MKQKILFSLIAMLLAPVAMKAQHLFPEDELTYIYRYSASELESAENLDSVFGYYEYGNNYYEYFEDSTQASAEALKCRNLQVLELHDVLSSELLSHLGEFPMLQVLILDNVGLTSIPDEIYELKNLKHLEIRRMNELWFDPSRFDGSGIHKLVLANVTTRIMSDEGNPIALQLDLFPNLTELVLGDEMSEVPASLYDLTQLTHLEIYSAGLSEISPAIGNLVNLEFLNLSSNEGLETLPNEMGNLVNLSELNLNACSFSELPVCLGNLTALTSLDVQYNPLVTIPEFAGNWVNLTHLYLSNTGISELPASLSNCVNLYTLYMYYCQLTEFPTAILGCTSLSDLDLSANAIASIPAGLSRLTGLMTLEVSNNPIRMIDPAALNLPSLYSLRMSGCPLYNIPMGIEGLTGLQYLDLSSDSIGSVNKNIYKLSNLRSLNLSMNQITEMPAGIASLSLLFDLTLSENRLTALPKDLVKLNELTYLTVNDNQLKKLPKGLGKMPQLGTIDLRGNKNIALSKDLAKLQNLYEIRLRPDDLDEKGWEKLRGWVGPDKAVPYEY
jgi:Leucine-rich repeat (LRR) protein